MHPDLTIQLMRTLTIERERETARMHALRQAQSQAHDPHDRRQRQIRSIGSLPGLPGRLRLRTLRRREHRGLPVAHTSLYR